MASTFVPSALPTLADIGAAPPVEEPYVLPSPLVEVAPSVPAPRGPISEHALALLRGQVRPDVDRPLVPLGVAAAIDDAPLTDDDLHLALYALYELHYRGFSGVDPNLEWSPTVLDLRSALEARFVDLLEIEVAGRTTLDPDEAHQAPHRLWAMLEEADGPSLSAWVAEHGALPHLQELAIHRSLYQLKEADPHTWAIPRLPAGPAKSAYVSLQLDEYGNGDEGRTHAELFATTMDSLSLDPTYGAYLDVVPGTTLATVNLLSMFGLHRRWVGACVGHLAVFEMTSVTPMGRYAEAHRRITGGAFGAEFYDVHVVADAEHEVIAFERLVPDLVAQRPDLADDLLFGAQALMALEQRFTEQVLDRWAVGETSLFAG